VSPGSTQELSDALAKLLGDAEARERIGRANARFATEYFSEEGLIRSYERVVLGCGDEASAEEA
jgi:glycosyltransferase involved in cell wall biosynthesis